MLAEVRRALDDAVPERASVVLAVSGGPDSTALAYLVTEARPDLESSVAHVRHGLRADAEDAEVAAVHAAALGLEYHERSVRVRPAGRGVEAAARDARYAALSRIARTVGARALIVGHTADDQAETVLLNIARGTGLRGLAGMPASRPDDSAVDAVHGVRLVRPLLRLRRSDVHAFVAGEGLRAVRDPTNDDPWQRRARVRHELLPGLAALSGGPGDAVGALTRLSDLARADADALDELAAAHARRMVVAWGPARAVPTDALASLHPALAGRVVRLLLRGVRAGAEVPAATVTDVLGLGPGDALHGPGRVWVTCGGGWLAAIPPDIPALPERALRVPGEVPIPALGLTVHGDHGEQVGDPRLDLGQPPPAQAPPAALAPPPPGAGHAPWAMLSVDTSNLVVRGRRAGDRLGGQRVTDVLSDAGIPRALRGLLPVVASADDEVVWVPGLPASAPPDPLPGGSRPRPLRLWLTRAG